MRTMKRALSGTAAVLAGMTLLAAPAAADAQTFQLAPGETQCVTLRATQLPGDNLYTDILFHGDASGPIHWTRWHDVVDGNDGFGNALLMEQTYLDRNAQYFSEQYGETDDGPGGQLDVWLCAENRGGGWVSATLEITTSQGAAPTYHLTRTGQTSVWGHGALQPGQSACTGGGGRHASIEAYLGLRLTQVTISNSKTTRQAINDTFAQLSIDSSQPGGYPEGLTGCIRNIDSAQLNFNFYFYWS